MNSELVVDVAEAFGDHIVEVMPAYLFKDTSGDALMRALQCKMWTDYDTRLDLYVVVWGHMPDGARAVLFSYRGNSSGVLAIAGNDKD